MVETFGFKGLLRGQAYISACVPRGAETDSWDFFTVPGQHFNVTGTGLLTMHIMCIILNDVFKRVNAAHSWM